MQTLSLEGTWEEIQKHGDQLVGRHVRLIVIEENDSEELHENTAMLAAIKRTRSLLGKMRYTNGMQSQDLLRSGRDGGMFAE